MKVHRVVPLLLLAAALPTGIRGQEEAPWPVARVDADLARPDPDASYWEGVPELALALSAQPMVRPRPTEVRTPGVTVQAVHDGTWLALRLRWSDDGPDEAGRLGKYSDAAAVQFPMTAAESPPPIFMGTKAAPVHIFHWRAQYQRDAERGKPTMRELYPNLSIDMYPLELPDPGSVEPAVGAREQYSPGRAVGNPQSFPKSGVDEIYAEGFSTSSVQESAAAGRGVWRDGTWTLVIVRPFTTAAGSQIEPGSGTFAAFAIWQGGADEVGSRKSVTMSWTALSFDDRVALASPPAVEVATQ